MMTIVLDSNILVAALGKTSKYRPIFDALILEQFKLAVSNEVLEEYAEVVERQTNADVSKNVIQLLLSLPSLSLVHPYYRWRLIVADPDNDKFVDCAVAANADYIVTEDKHFKVLLSTAFPKVNVLSGEDFIALLKRV